MRDNDNPKFDPGNEREYHWELPGAQVEVSWVDALGSPLSGTSPQQLTAEEMKVAYGLIDRLKWNSQVKRIAEALLNQPRQPLESLQPLLKAIIRPNKVSWRERQVATGVLGRAPLNMEQRDFAAKTLSQILEGKLEQDTITKLKRSAWGTLLFTLPLASTIEPWGRVPAAALTSAVVGIFPFLLLLITTQEHHHSVSIRAAAASALGHLGHPASLDALASALHEKTGIRRLASQRKLRDAAAKALPSVLITLTSEHYGQIRRDTMENLCRALNHSDDTLVLAILSAFLYIGDSRSLPHVQKLASGGGKAGKDSRIREAATACLARIQIRIQQENNPQTLLRASTPPLRPSEELLRPAAYGSGTDPFQLLRAATQEQMPSSEQDRTLLLSLLSDLENFRDSRALPYVEQIAVNETMPPTIRHAAEACLPALRARAEIESLTQPSYQVQDSNEPMQNIGLRNSRS